MPYSLSLGEQPRDWLDNHQLSDPALARIVARWLTDVLCADETEVDALPLTSNSGQRRYVSRVLDVTWLDAIPFRTMRVLWIEEA